MPSSHTPSKTPSTLPQQIESILERGVAEILPSAESLSKLMAQKKIRVYLGIDPTGAFLTLGHSVVLRKLQQFAELGHEVILLIGNGTVRIGDPTGRDTTRPVLTDQAITENFQNWKTQASKILDFTKIKIMYNGDWLDKLTFSDLIKLMAQTTVQQLIERDMFQQRINSGLPIYGHEILYPLLQGYDSVAMDVDLEIGGSDQTFNMLMGRQLQRVYNNHEKWVLSTPIINGTDGRKMSKSYCNFIALTDHPNDMYGKLMSISDDLIVEYFMLLTDVSLAEIAQIKKAVASGENPMQFKKQLAFWLTAFYHDEKLATAAAEHFKKTVQNKEIPSELEPISLTGVENGRIRILDVLKSCLPSETNANLKRLVEQGAVEFLPAGTKPSDFTTLINPADLDIVRIGKRRYFKIV